MTARKHDNEDLVGDALVRTFQRYGYEGASLSNISQETGLIKASLYHRFPEGKEQMASAALETVEGHFRDEILAPLEGHLPLRKRLDEVIRRLRLFYDSGRRSCLLDTLSLEGTPEQVAQRSAATAALWAGAFAKVARAAGMKPGAARVAAETALVQIEGALVLSRLTRSGTPFDRALARLPSILLG